MDLASLAETEEDKELLSNNEHDERRKSPNMNPNSMGRTLP
jgi:hypothetical protein